MMVGYIPGDSLHHRKEKETTKSTLTNNPTPEEGMKVDLQLGIYGDCLFCQPCCQVFCTIEAGVGTDDEGKHKLHL